MEVFNHYKSDLKRHAHTLSGDAGADLQSLSGEALRTLCLLPRAGRRNHPVRSLCGVRYLRATKWLRTARGDLDCHDGQQPCKQAKRARPTGGQLGRKKTSFYMNTKSKHHSQPLSPCRIDTKSRHQTTSLFSPLFWKGGLGEGDDVVQKRISVSGGPTRPLRASRLDLACWRCLEAPGRINTKHEHHPPVTPPLVARTCGHEPPGKEP